MSGKRQYENLTVRDLKRLAKLTAKKKGLKLSEAQDEVARDASFRDWHDAVYQLSKKTVPIGVTSRSLCREIPLGEPARPTVLDCSLANWGGWGDKGPSAAAISNGIYLTSVMITAQSLTARYMDRWRQAVGGTFEEACEFRRSAGKNDLASLTKARYRWIAACGQDGAAEFDQIVGYLRRPDTSPDWSSLQQELAERLTKGKSDQKKLDEQQAFGDLKPEP